MATTEHTNTLPRSDDFGALCEGIAVTVCCGAFATFHDETLCCKACWEEVGFGDLPPCYRVGRMVYSSLEEAKAKAAYAAESLNVAASVIDHRTGEVLATYPTAVRS